MASLSAAVVRRGVFEPSSAVRVKRDSVDLLGVLVGVGDREEGIWSRLVVLTDLEPIGEDGKDLLPL